LTGLAALTGYGQESDRQRAIEAGFDYHLVKPVSVEALEDLLASPPRHSAESLHEHSSESRTRH